MPSIFGKIFTLRNQNTKQDAIGIIKITGEINLEFTETTIKKITAFSEDHNVKGILLLISSCGGQIGCSELIFREIKLLAEKKPIVSLAVNSCCYGAYCIAIGSSWIMAQNSSRLGSIGAALLIEKHRSTRMHEEAYSAEVDYELIYAGKFKCATHPNKPLLDLEEYCLLKEEVDASYKLFFTLVAQERNLSLENVEDWADGKIFNGACALEKGLIDQIGVYSDAINKLVELIEERGTLLLGKLVFID